MEKTKIKDCTYYIPHKRHLLMGTDENFLIISEDFFSEKSIRIQRSIRQAGKIFLRKTLQRSYQHLEGKEFVREKNEFCDKRKKSVQYEVL